MTHTALVRTPTGRLARQCMTLGGTVLDEEGDAVDGPRAWAQTQPLGGGGLRWADWVRAVMMVERVVRWGEA